jgi:DNA-binding MarR family transcriptional regulator
MEKQLELFKMYHDTDPDSSRQAAREHVHSGQNRKQRQIAFEAVSRHPNCTSKEIAAYEGLDRAMIARRLPEIERNGLIEKVRTKFGQILIRPCKIGGQNSCEWRTTQYR